MMFMLYNNNTADVTSGIGTAYPYGTRGHSGRDRIVVGFTITCAISA